MKQQDLASSQTYGLFIRRKKKMIKKKKQGPSSWTLSKYRLPKLFTANSFLFIIVIYMYIYIKHQQDPWFKLKSRLLVALCVVFCSESLHCWSCGNQSSGYRAGASNPERPVLNLTQRSALAAASHSIFCPTWPSGSPAVCLKGSGGRQEITLLKVGLGSCWWDPALLVVVVPSALCP